MAKEYQVDVEGLNDFLKALRGVDKAFSTELKVAAKAVASMVAERARNAAQNGSRQSSLASPGIRAATDRVPTIAYGGSKKVVTAEGRKVAVGSILFGSDFGAGRGVRTRQFPSYMRSGRYLFPTIRSSREDIMRDYAEALDKVSREAFPD